MITGLNAAGVDVADLRVLPSAVARHLMKTQGYDAGIHVGVSQSDPETIWIRFFEQPGIQMTTGLEKDVEKHFNRRELRRVPFGDIGNVTYPARVREQYAQDLLSTARQGRDRAARLPRRRRLRLLGVVVRAPAGARAARDRGGLGARVHHRVDLDGVLAARVDRAGQAARRSDRRRPRRRLRPGRRPALPRRRAGPRGPGRADPAPVPAPRRRSRLAGEGGGPGDGHAPRRGDRLGLRPRGRAHSCRAGRAGEGRHRRGRRLRGGRRRRVHLPAVPARLRRGGEPLQAARAARARPAAAVGARRRAAASRTSSTGSSPARGRSRASSCACSPSS